MDFQDPDFQEGIRDLLGLQQRQKLIKLQQEQLEEQRRQQSNRPSAPLPTPKNRQCPWCGGALAGKFDKCCHCASSVAWVKGIPCKPGQEKALEDELARKEQREREEETERQRAAMYVNCSDCKVELLKSKVADAYLPLCQSCEKTRRRDANVIACVIVATLCVIVIGFLIAALVGGELSHSTRNAIAWALALCVILLSLIICVPVVITLRPKLDAWRTAKASRDKATIEQTRQVRVARTLTVARDKQYIVCPCSHVISCTPPLPDDGVKCPSCERFVPVPSTIASHVELTAVSSGTKSLTTERELAAEHTVFERVLSPGSKSSLMEGLEWIWAVILAIALVAIVAAAVTNDGLSLTLAIAVLLALASIAAFEARRRRRRDSTMSSGDKVGSANQSIVCPCGATIRYAPPMSPSGIKCPECRKVVREGTAEDTSSEGSYAIAFACVGILLGCPLLILIGAFLTDVGSTSGPDNPNAILASDESGDPSRSELVSSPRTNDIPSHAELSRIAAAAKLAEARGYIKAMQIREAIAKLHEYTSDPFATEKQLAESLLRDSEFITSPNNAIDFVRALSDVDLERLQDGGLDDIGTIQDLDLRAAWLSTLKAALPVVEQERKAVAAAKRESERKSKEKALQEKLADLNAKKSSLDKELQDLESQKQALLDQQQSATPVSLKDLNSFPEDYINKYVLLPQVWIWGDFERNRKYRVYSATVDSGEGLLVTNLIVGEGLVFVMSEELGRLLNLRWASSDKVKCNLWCQVEHVEKHYFARLYKVDLIKNNGETETHIDNGFSPVGAASVNSRISKLTAQLESVEREIAAATSGKP